MSRERVKMNTKRMKHVREMWRVYGGRWGEGGDQLFIGSWNNLKQSRG